jgi:membrane protein implicated in regulation of membrane protease activity
MRYLFRSLYLFSSISIIYEKYISYVYTTKIMKFSKEYSLGVLLILIVIMVLKPNLLGFMYNNVLGKLVFVAAVVFLSLKHTAAGLLAVVFVAVIATMSGYQGFEGMEGKHTEGEATQTTADEKKKTENTPVDHPTEPADPASALKDMLNGVKKEGYTAPHAAAPAPDKKKH